MLSCRRLSAPDLFQRAASFQEVMGRREHRGDFFTRSRALESESNRPRRLALSFLVRSRTLVCSPASIALRESPEVWRLVSLQEGSTSGPVAAIRGLLKHRTIAVRTPFHGAESTDIVQPNFAVDTTNGTIEVLQS